MGLDLVEQVLAYEEAFGIDIPDASAAQLGTPRAVLDYFVSRRSPRHSGVRCLSQPTFHSLRRALAEEGVPRVLVRLDRQTRFVSPEGWAAVGQGLCLRLPTPMPRTVGELVRGLVGLNFAVLSRRHMAWTRADAWEAIRHLLADRQGIPLERIDPDARFVEDLHLD